MSSFGRKMQFCKGVVNARVMREREREREREGVVNNCQTTKAGVYLQENGICCDDFKIIFFQLHSNDKVLFPNT